MQKICYVMLAGLLAGCASLPPGELEEIRAEGANSRARHPHYAVGGYGTLDQALALVATGESEEIDYWRLSTQPLDADRARLRQALDAAGGRGVQILGPDEVYRPRVHAAAVRPIGNLDASVLIAGTDRAMSVNGTGRVEWEKRGCGNIHSVRKLGKFIYYSNGAIWRVPANGDKWMNPQLVWKSKNAVGGGALCFDLTPEGNLVFAVNSTGEVVELDPYTRKEVVRFPVNFRNEKNEPVSAHGKLRSAHKNAVGNYIVSCAEAAVVRIYNRDGALVQELKTPGFTFDAIQRDNGNIVVSHVSGVTEYNPAYDVVWTLMPADLPGLNAANFTSLQQLPNGNLVVGTWANGAADSSRAGAFEVTPTKRVVWALASSTDINMMGAYKLDGSK